MKHGLIIAILLTALISQAAPPPVNVTINQQPTAVVKIDDGSSPAVSITVPGSDVLSIVTAGPQGIPGPAGANGTIGVDGSPGPNLLTTSTVTPLNGILKGTGSNVTTAAAGSDYVTPGSLATVATTGSYPDLANKPEIPIACVNIFDGRPIELQVTATHIQWRYVGDASWTNLVALSTITGPAGSTGANGKTVLSSSGVPSNSLGVDGDFCIDTTNAHFYGPKAGGAWPGTYIEMVGPQGLQGPAGPPGAMPNQAAIFGVVDDPIDGATMWVQQGSTEQATNAKSGTRDRDGNSKQWIDGNGTMVRQCITSDSAPAFKMLNPSGTVLYTVSCDSTMTFTGTVTIK